MKLHGVTRNNNYSWLENYLSNRKQYIVINNNENSSF